MARAPKIRLAVLCVGLALSLSALFADLKYDYFKIWTMPHPPTLESLEPGLRSRFSARRVEALQKAIALDPYRSTKLAARFLHDPSPAVRLEAVDYFGNPDRPWEAHYYADDSLPASAFIPGLYDVEPVLAYKFAAQVGVRARRGDLPALIGFLLSRRAEWATTDAEITVGKAIGRIAGFDPGYKEQRRIAMCGNPYMAASAEVDAKVPVSERAEAQNLLALHFDLPAKEWDFDHRFDPENRRARERVLAWWRRTGKKPLVAPEPPPLRADPQAFLREHPVQTLITSVGRARYESSGFVRVIPVTVAAGGRQALFKGAELRYPNFGSATEITLTAVSDDRAEGEARQYEYPAPMDTQRLPTVGQRVTSSQSVHDELEGQ